MEELQTIQQQKKLLMSGILKKKIDRINNFLYRQNPDLWLTERFGEDIKQIKWSEYPEYKDHKWDGDVDPLYKMWKGIASGTRQWIGAESATGTGKTFTLARVIFWFLDVYKDSLVVISAPKEEQLDKQVWAEVGKAFHKFKRLHPFAELTKSILYVDSRRTDDRAKDSSHIASTFVAGVKANEESTTKAQGFHREHMLILTEETPGMPLPTLQAFTTTSNSKNNRILAVGNPDSIVDPLHNFIDTYNNVEGVRISALDHPNVVLGREIIPGCCTRYSIETINLKYGKESAFAKSRTRGICPAQGTDSLFKHSWIQQCKKGSVEYKKLGEIDRDNSSPALGVDVANSDSGDKACLAFGLANILMQLHEFQCPDSNALAYNLIWEDHEIEASDKHIEIYNTSKISQYGISDTHIGVDTVGVGAGTANVLKEEGYNIIPLHGGQDKRFLPLDENHEETKSPTDTSVKYLYEFASLRAQMYWEAAIDLKERNIILDLPEEIYNSLVKELIVINYMVKAKIVVESKENIKKKLGGKSPNLADAFVYWNWVRKDRSLDVGPMPFIV